MCMYNALKRCGAFVAALVLCFALCVPAFAEDILPGSVNFQVIAHHLYSGTDYGWDASRVLSISSGSSSNVLLDGDGFAGTFSQFAFWHFSLADSFFPSNSQSGIYLSFYYGSPQTGSQNHVPTASDFKVRYKDSDTGAYKYAPISVTLFSPSSSLNSLSDGVTVSSRLSNLPSAPISTVRLANGSVDSHAPSFIFNFASPVSTSSVLCYTNVTSFRVVSTASNAELDALEDMASNIAAQNQILSQFYGDIVAVCNQIYQRLGDIQAAQEEANRLFSNVISLLNTTNGKLEAINMAMSTYFELLINQLKQEGIDTRTAIADAEARLEAYLKPMIDYFTELEKQTGESAATLPGHKTDIDGFNNQGFGIDSDGQAGVAALVPILSAFGWIWSIIALFIGVGLIHILVKKGIG